MRFVAVAGISVIALTSMVYAQEWRPVARQCSEEIDQKLHCASCGGAWPLWTRCTAERAYGGRISMARLEACMQQIWDRRWKEQICSACGDPVAESISCSLKR